MGRTLRYLATYPEPEVAPLLGDNIRHLCWMYEHYALPYRDAGFTRLNLVLQALGGDDLPSPLVDPFGRTAEVRVPFDTAAFGRLSVAEQKRYYVGRLHDGVVRCVGHFGWDRGRFEAAYGRMLAADLHLAFWWKQPLGSPNRRVRVQGFVEAGPVASLWLVFSDRQGAERSRCLLAVVPCGSGCPGEVFGRIQWVDDATVRVTHRNGRDYWICEACGEAQFHYPRAEQGDAHGEFDLGRMYYEGGLLPPDRDRGLALLRAAAAKGYQHAVRFVQRLEQAAAGTDEGAV